MSYNPTLLLPTNENDFETLCCHIAREKYQDNDAQKYGRRGQRQWGVDIKAIDRRTPNGQPLVIQCKFKKPTNKNQLKQIQKELVGELTQALDGPLTFSKFIYAYTGVSDNNLDNFADQLSQQHGVDVVIWSIDDIVQDIESNLRLKRLYSIGTSKLGVSIINQDFIDGLGAAEQADTDVFRFYSGYSGNDEQWLGILNNLDAPRRQTSAIKAQCEMLMTRKILEARVAAVVYGGGGSGKSTLLRRLAIDNVLESKPYVNWWVEDIDAFLEFDAHCITDTKDQQHIVFVEDWYRNVTFDQGQRLLAWLKQQSNALVIVGDRTNDGLYRDGLYGNYCQQLQASDNNEVLSHIFSEEALGRHKSLRAIIEEVQSSPQLLENVPISMVLFVVAWQYQNNLQDESFGIKEGFDNAFKNIIHGLLKALESNEKYQGFGKALHLAARTYWSPSSRYFSLRESTFINIAEILSNNDNQLATRMAYQNSRPYQNNYPSQIECLVHRVTTTTSLNPDISRIQFNHDVIAEQGIALIDDDDFVLDAFDQHKLLTTLIEKKQAEGALLLWQLWAADDKKHVSEFEFNVLLEVMALDDVLLHFAIVLIHIIKTRLSAQHKRVVGRQLLLLPEFYKVHPGVISTALTLLKGKPEGVAAATTILALPEFYQLSDQIISTALTLLKDQPEGIAGATTILALPEFYLLSDQIISTALILLKDQPEGVAAATTIVALPDFYQLPYSIIATALNLLKEQPEGNAAAKTILALSEFYHLPDSIVTTALNLLKEQPEGMTAAKTILALSEFYQLPHQTISTALNVLKDRREGVIAAKTILALPDFYQLPETITATALKLLTGQDEGGAAATAILALPEFYKLPDAIITTALKLLKDQPEGIIAAKAILALPEFYNLPYQTVSTALKLLTGQDAGIAAAKTILALPEFYQLPVSIITTALNLLKDQSEGLVAAKTILALPDLYQLPQQVISTALNLLKDKPIGWKASRAIINEGITKQTFLLFAAIRSLCLSSDHRDMGIVANIYREIKPRNKEKNNPGVIRLWNDLFWLPLMGIKEHKNRISGAITHYKFNSSSFAKFNLFKILKCYTLDYPEKNQLSIKMNRVQQSIVLYSVVDIQHQLSHSPSNVQLGHINIAMKNTPASDLKFLKAKEIAALADGNSILANHPLHETVLAIIG